MGGTFDAEFFYITLAAEIFKRIILKNLVNSHQSIKVSYVWLLGIVGII